MTEKIKKTEEEWRKELTPEQYRVLRQKGTERPFTGEYEGVMTPGVYKCAACGEELFLSGYGFPGASNTRRVRADTGRGCRRSSRVHAAPRAAHPAHFADPLAGAPERYAMWHAFHALNAVRSACRGAETRSGPIAPRVRPRSHPRIAGPRRPARIDRK